MAQRKRNIFRTSAPFVFYSLSAMAQWRKGKAIYLLLCAICVLILQERNALG